MIDKQLEKNIQDLRLFMDLWVRFYDLLMSAKKMEQVVTKDEADFLAIKSELARRHKVLTITLGMDYALDPNLMNIISQAISLDSLASSSDIAVRKLENEWHRAYISINETLGGLENKREVTANKSAFSAAMENFQQNILGNKAVIVVVIIVVIAGVLVLLNTMFPELFSSLKDWYMGMLGKRT
jgi:hypothetical protein